jgi:putative spermidine/putrescine transport system permease protein
MTLCLSAFVIPMVLGKGRILFVANLIYTRFSEVADYPSGAAISLVMLALSLIVIYGVTRLTDARWGT